MTVVRGTKVREVSEPRLLEKCRVLEEADLSKPGQVETALQNLNQQLKNEHTPSTPSIPRRIVPT